jgi:hypothetical protein
MPFWQAGGRACQNGSLPCLLAVLHGFRSGPYHAYVFAILGSGICECIPNTVGLNVAQALILAVPSVANENQVGFQTTNVYVIVFTTARGIGAILAHD